MINRKDDYQESYEQTVITLALSVTGMLFSCACLVVNISYRKYRLDIQKEHPFVSIKRGRTQRKCSLNLFHYFAQQILQDTHIRSMIVIVMGMPVLVTEHCSP